MNESDLGMFQITTRERCGHRPWPRSLDTAGPGTVANARQNWAGPSTRTLHGGPRSDCLDLSYWPRGSDQLSGATIVEFWKQPEPPCQI